MKIRNRLEVREIIVFAFLPTVIVVTTIVTNPFFGNMDDSWFLSRARESDPISFALGLAGGTDLGFIRFSSVLIVWPSYLLGATFGPLPLYLTNAIVVFCALSAFGFAVHQILGWRRKWLFYIFFAATLAWPFTAELFVFPSLSEKGIVLGAALALLWAHHAVRFSSVSLYWISFIAVFAFAFSTKTQFLVFVPTIVFVLWLSWREARLCWVSVRFVLPVAIICGLSALIGILALTGSYTSGTQGSMNENVLGDIRFLALAGLSALYGACLLLRVVRGKFSAPEMVPLILLLSMTSAFLVWQIRNYFLAIAGVIVGTAIAAMSGWVRKQSLISLVAVILSAIAGVWLVFRLETLYGTQSSIGAFLNSAVAEDLNEQGAILQMTCLEAPTHFNTYAQRSHLSNIEFRHNPEISRDKPIVGGRPQYIFADARLCPWVPPDNEWRVIWSTGDASRFQLFQDNS